MKAGFVGLGTMGRHMARNLMDFGNCEIVVVHDVRREAAEPHLAAGALWADTPRQVAEQVDVVFTSLPGPVEVESVALGDNGLLAGMRPGAAWFDLSTNSPTLMRHLHMIFAEQGIDVMDAPVSGGPIGADTRKLAIWLGGDEKVFDSHKEVLDAIGDQPAYIGPIGAGLVAKLVHNLSGYIVQTGLAEAFTMGVRAGVEPDALFKAIRQGSVGRRRTFDNSPPFFLSGEYDPPSFALRLAHKDVTLATSLGRELGVPMRLAQLTLEEMTEALNRGWAEFDSRIAMTLQEERAGVEVKVPEERWQHLLD
jgi:3-hydroxyisobutyrate dehydrogenase-like beta-hydroxyacid dehydrogenase